MEEVERKEEAGVFWTMKDITSKGSDARLGLVKLHPKYNSIVDPFLSQ